MLITRRLLRLCPPSGGLEFSQASLRVLMTLVCLAFLAVPATAGDPAALAVSVRGPARVLILPAGGGTLRQATVTRLQSLDTLPAGVFVQVGAGGQVCLVYHADGHREDLAGPCLVRVAPGGSHLVKGSTQAIQHSESEVAEAVSPAPVVRAQVSPGTRISVSNPQGVPRFTWSTNYLGPLLAVLYQPGPPRVNVWSSEQSDKSVLYSGPTLMADTPYVFQLEQDDRALAAVRFQVSSSGALASLGNARAEVQKSLDDPTSLALLALALDQRGDLSGAVQTMQSALDKQPDDAAFVRRMSEMVAEMGDEARANVLRNRAKGLEDSFPGLTSADASGLDLYLDGVVDPFIW